MTNRPSFDSVNIGDAPPPLVCDPLTRTQLVRYAGASHDFNPNHHDEVYARANGNKAVFGMGMLAGGYCARLVTDWLGDGALRRLRIRFASRFWPGDVVGLLLTGMGRDGALGLKELRNRGHHTIAQDEATSAVYGMPKAAAALDAAVDILPPERIAAKLIELSRRS